jgi:hypothetical protein
MSKGEDKKMNRKPNINEIKKSKKKEIKRTRTNQCHTANPI